ncbi:MAG: prenyltransferase/squalene oxidase repeat-containing protein [Marmoricola sp.]
MRGNARTSRIVAYAASGALVISGTFLAVHPAAAAPDPQPSNDAAAWLADELDGGMFTGAFSQGLSIDAALALDEIGGQDAAVDGVSSALEPVVGDYISYEGYVYAGSAAKAAVLAQVAGANASAYGEYDLIAEVEDKVATAAPSAGRVPDTNVLGQAFASRSLAVAGSSRAADATAFLLKQQCSSGYFRLDYNSNPAAANQSCVNGTDAPDTDVTAITVTQLRAQPATPAITSAIARATSWLAGQQRCDGSYGGGVSTEGSNSNSTGLAAWALGDTPASRQAATWLRKHQATAADAGNELGDDLGAIAYDDAALTAGRSSGITDATRDQWRRTTAQAAPGLAWFSTDPTPALSLTGPTGYVKQATLQTLRTSGAAAGTVVCVTGPLASTRGIAAANGLSSVVRVPGGTATRVYTAKDPYGHVDTVALKVLGQKTLPVTRSQYKVKRNRTVTTMISGLVPGEWSRIFYKGKLVRSGKATSTGRFAATFNVGRARGKKTVVGYGYFTDIRRGATTIKVRR